jgi:hypothetical protein
MALLDVSDIFDDPDLMDDLVCVRTTSARGSNGRPVATGPTEIPFKGSVQDPGFDARKVAAEGQLNPGNMVVYTTFTLSSGSEQDGSDADTVRFKGQDFTVHSISDWSNWGAGFIVATLTPVAIS